VVSHPIVISWPEARSDEVAVVEDLFAAGLAVFHLRKPESSATALAAFIEQVPAAYRDRIVLHSHHELCREYGLRGVHVRSTWQAEYGTGGSDGIGVVAREALAAPRGVTVSASCHRLSDLTDVDRQRPGFDYVFISPVFASISKPGYRPAFDHDDLVGRLRETTTPVVALGGITAANIGRVRQAGFAGAAVLGAVWQAADPLAAWQTLNEQWS